MTLDSPLTVFRGIGAKTEAELKKQNISCVRDLLECFPSAYRSVGSIVKVSDALTSEFSMFKLTVKSKPYFISRSRSRSIFTFLAEDESGAMRVTFFNQSYYSNLFKTGSQWIFYGKPRLYKDRPSLDNPKVFPLEDENTILPIYPVSGIKQKTLRAAVQRALSETEDIREPYSPEMLRRYSLIPKKEELTRIHAPKTEDDYIGAGKSRIFKDFLAYCCAVNSQGTKTAPPIRCGEETPAEYRKLFPFEFTGAQTRAIKEIAEDMRSEKPMNRLLQGDVGSGKTAVALFASYAAMKNHAQSVIMAPTELLAVQHYIGAEKIFGNSVALLTSSTRESERERIRRGVEAGSISVLIGTHAVLYESLNFHNLAVTVADEQHRFGVEQRAALCRLTDGTHSLTMSATPIPRTLALSVYGRVDITVLDELPAGRKPVKTFVVSEEKRKDMYNWMKEKILAGRQAYVVCPLIENVDEMDVRSVSEVYGELTSKFPRLRISALSGQMRPSEKELVMSSFRDGNTDILVSTTVIEVGVDVRNAAVMIIENAERFGLATLHQLRGRVGRGDDEAFCCLVSDAKNAERLRLLSKTSDGFEIAKYDLKQRGGGQFWGIRQHGELEREARSIIDNPEIYHLASEAFKTLETDFPDDYKTLTELSAEKTAEFGRIVSN